MSRFICSMGVPKRRALAQSELPLAGGFLVLFLTEFGLWIPVLFFVCLILCYNLWYKNHQILKCERIAQDIRFGFQNYGSVERREMGALLQQFSY